MFTPYLGLFAVESSEIGKASRDVLSWKVIAEHNSLFEEALAVAKGGESEASKLHQELTNSLSPGEVLHHPLKTLHLVKAKILKSAPAGATRMVELGTWTFLEGVGRSCLFVLAVLRDSISINKSWAW
jgi:hypothetical protein